VSLLQGSTAELEPELLLVLIRILCCPTGADAGGVIVKNIGVVVVAIEPGEAATSLDENVPSSL